MKILFVCTGNTCRSPMAEGYLKNKNISELIVTSKGLAATGQKASNNAIKVMAEVGIDISNHISSSVSVKDIKENDKIICLSKNHFNYFLMFGVPENKLIILSEGISDPFGGNIEQYRKCRDEIFKSIDNLIEKDTFSEYNIISMEEKHLASVAKLEQVCFSQPWSQKSLLESMEHGSEFYIAEKNNTVLGYIGLNIAADEGYITNVAVFPNYRKKGIATALLNKIILFSEEKKLNFISLEVRESNYEAIKLYQKLLFVTEGKRKDFYRSPTENALIMTRRFNKNNEDTQH